MNILYLMISKMIHIYFLFEKKSWQLFESVILSFLFDYLS